MAREGALQTRIKKRLKSTFGGKWYVIAGGPFQETGIHDIIGCLEGRFIGFEVKKPGEEDEWDEMQQYQHRTVIKQGGISAMIISFGEAKKVLLKAGFDVRSNPKRTEFSQTFKRGKG